MYLIGVSEWLSFNAKLGILTATVKLVINGHLWDKRKMGHKTIVIWPLIYDWFFLIVSSDPQWFVYYYYQMVI
jgi:hypothetical protein